MKKLIGLLFFFASIVAVALNFNGNQSLNGLQTTTIFTAPANGYYFVNGQLTLPPGSLVASVVSSTGAAGLVYTGVSGATGFQVRQISMVSGDAVKVTLSSATAADNALNAVRGQVSYGNSF